MYYQMQSIVLSSNDSITGFQFQYDIDKVFYKIL